MSDETRCVVDGIEYQLYAIEFEVGGLTFTTSTWAKSFEDAEVMLNALKETGEIVGMKE